MHLNRIGYHRFYAGVTRPISTVYMQWKTAQMKKIWELTNSILTLGVGLGTGNEHQFCVHLERYMHKWLIAWKCTHLTNNPLSIQKTSHSYHKFATVCNLDSWDAVGPIRYGTGYKHGVFDLIHTTLGRTAFPDFIAHGVKYHLHILHYYQLSPNY